MTQRKSFGGSCGALVWALAAAPALVISGVVAAGADDVPETFRLFRTESSVYLTPKGSSLLEKTASDGRRIILARSARMNPFDPRSAKVGDRVVIDVTPGESYVAVLDRVNTIRSVYENVFGLSGRIEGFADSFVRLAFTTSDAWKTMDVVGKVFFGGRFVTIEPEGSGINLVLIRETVSTSLEGAPGRQPNYIDGFDPYNPERTPKNASQETTESKPE